MTGAFEELIGSNEPVLVDFTADWCKPCKKISTMLSQLVDELDDDLLVVKIDVDKNVALKKKFKLEAVPTLMLFQNGKLLWRHTGLISAPEVRNALRKVL